MRLVILLTSITTLLLLSGCTVQPPLSGSAVTPTIPLAAATPVVTSSGLTFIELASGSGDLALPGDVVEIHYRGLLADGTQFDSSYAYDQPLQFILGQGMVIKGWEEGVALMRKGGKARLIIPPELAYGNEGAGGIIPPNATLTFEVELVEIRPAPRAAPEPVAPEAFTTTPSGLQYYDLQPGSGTEALPGKTLAVHYTGWLSDGTRFDTTRQPRRPMGRPQPFRFTLGKGEVIAGWDEGLVGMRVGGKRQLVIPAELAYAERGAGELIPPGATLIFEVELVEVE